MLPDRIGHYEVQEIAGQGGMAVVYRAYDSRQRRDVAIKVMMQQHLHNDKLRVRFTREAQTIRTLSYPTIVPLFDFGEFGPDHLPFLVMGYMPRGSLKERIARGPLPINEVVKVVQRIGLALDYAHSRDVIHRDIKPGNILFDESDHPYLADFGIAISGQAGQTILTGDNLAVGTPAYMSPEQGKGERVDARTDIYSLGAVLFEMLTGRQPYASDTPMTPLAIMLMHVQKPIPDVLTYNPGLPAGMGDVIRRAMAKGRAERYATANEMVAALKAVSRGTVTPPDGVPATPRVHAARTPPEGLPTVVAPAVRAETAAAKPDAQPKAERRIPSWLVGAGGLFMLLLLALCVGGGWWVYSNLLAPTPTAAATAPVATTAPTVAGPTAAAVEEATVELQSSTRAPAGPDAGAVTPDDPALVPTLRPTRTPESAVSPVPQGPELVLRSYTCLGSPAEFTRGSEIMFVWEWPAELEEGQYLEIRVGPAGDPNPVIVGGRVEPSLRDGIIWRWPLRVDDFVRSGVVEYEWQVYLMGAGQVELQNSPRGCLRVTP